MGRFSQEQLRELKDFLNVVQEDPGEGRVGNLYRIAASELLVKVESGLQKGAVSTTLTPTSESQGNLLGG